MAQTKVKLISDGVIDVNHLASGHGITTDNIGEGSNLYYTDARVSTYLSTNNYATEGFVTTAVSNLVASAPSTLDTLNELAAALGDDPNFATTVTNSIAGKLPLAGGLLTGSLEINRGGGVYDTGTDLFFLTHNENTRYKGFVRLKTPAGEPIFSIGTINTGVTYDTLFIRKGNVGIGTDNPSTVLLSIRGYGGIDSNANQGLTLTSNHYYDSGDKYRGNGYASIISQDTGGTYAGYIRFQQAGLNSSGAGAAMTLSDSMVIDESGNVGINTTSPRATFEIKGFNTTNGSVWLENASKGDQVSHIHYGSTGNWYIRSASTSGTVIMQDGGGNVAIGRDTASAKLHIDGNNVLIAGNTPNDYGQRYLEIQGSRASSGQSTASLYLNQIWNGVAYNAIVEAQKGSIIGNAAADLVFKTSYWNGSSVVTSERLRITDTGVLQIGSNTTPALTSRLFISRGDQYGLHIDTQTGFSRIVASDDNLYLGTGTNSSTVTIKNNLVGIGTTSPGYKLHIDGSSAGLNFSGGNNRIYFNGYRAIEGSVTGSILQVGEGYDDIALQANTGVNTTSPTATLDVNGSHRFRGDNYSEYTWNASGNYTSGTYYNIVDNFQGLLSGMYVIHCYVDTYAVGGAIYFMHFASVPFYWVNTATNNNSYQDLPQVLGTGHARNGVTPPSFRLQQTYGTSGSYMYLQFNPNANWSSINGNSGQTFTVWLKRIGG